MPRTTTGLRRVVGIRDRPVHALARVHQAEDPHDGQPAEDVVEVEEAELVAELVGHDAVQRRGEVVLRDGLRHDHHEVHLHRVGTADHDLHRVAEPEVEARDVVACVLADVPLEVRPGVEDEKALVSFPIDRRIEAVGEVDAVAHEPIGPREDRVAAHAEDPGSVDRCVGRGGSRSRPPVDRRRTRNTSPPLVCTS